MSRYNRPRMSSVNPTTAPVSWIDLQREQLDLGAEVRAGLRRTPKQIAAKFFYDAEGSRLFEEITKLPEYYLTRTELAILRRHAGEITRRFGDEYTLIEPGSGSSEKVRILLDAEVRADAYVAIDLSGEFLRASCEAIAADYSELEVTAVSADYTRLTSVPTGSDRGRRIVFFPGSTLGNLEPHEANAFFRHVAQWLRVGDGMLVGVDQKKDPGILHAAYNDSRGITARFNLNLLQRINRDLRAGFDVDAWEHVAFYNGSESRIEMHLRSLCVQSVTIAGETFFFSEDELLHTENSYKYDDAAIESLLHGSGFVRGESWKDEREWFAVHYLERTT